MVGVPAYPEWWVSPLTAPAYRRPGFVAVDPGGAPWHDALALLEVRHRVADYDDKLVQAVFIDQNTLSISTAPLSFGPFISNSAN